MRNTLGNCCQGSRSKKSWSFGASVPKVYVLGKSRKHRNLSKLSSSKSLQRPAFRLERRRTPSPACPPRRTLLPPLRFDQGRRGVRAGHFPDRPERRRSRYRVGARHRLRLLPHPRPHPRLHERSRRRRYRDGSGNLNDSGCYRPALRGRGRKSFSNVKMFYIILEKKIGMSYVKKIFASLESRRITIFTRMPRSEAR